MKLASPQAVLFDLDGTLVDTADDLVAALVAVRKRLKVTMALPENIRQLASRGAIAMLEAGLPEQYHDDIEEDLRDEFLRNYGQNICVHSKVYTGGLELIARLNQFRIPWGIVTNKPAGLAQQLLHKLNLRPGVLVGGDSLTSAKPSPEPVLYACRALRANAEKSWMVGDDIRDIKAGLAAGCAATVACAYGYLGDSPPIETWGATWIARSVSELRL
jgi:N-acetyl-D-muramate 6-phosphate phosphatase